MQGHINTRTGIARLTTLTAVTTLLLTGCVADTEPRQTDQPTQTQNETDQPAPSQSTSTRPDNRHRNNHRSPDHHN